jgi:hypothetical protein
LDDLHPAFFTDHSPVFHALIFSAIALIILGRAEYLGTKKAFPFRFKGPVIDGLRLFHLTMRPFPDLLRRGQRKFYGIKIRRVFGLGKVAE